eukprot:TRINITY_DN12579_c0_g1_i1.p1 TRINITY_DN12579_c0_g1~~TRINITY_DN12579_c0_g1_i1.p1  ORF type:complete len:101 (+),score=14.39 TRINITY_DN12579_c0_g1_i1:68-370(+)
MTLGTDASPPSSSPRPAVHHHGDSAEIKYMKAHDVPEMVDTMVTYLNTVQPDDPSKALIAFLCHYKGIDTPKEITPFDKLHRGNSGYEAFSGENGNGKAK